MNKTKDELLTGNELLSKLSEQVPGVIYQYRLYPDGSSCFPYSSPGMIDIYGVSPEEVREDATPVFSRLHPEDYENIVSTIMESARTLELYHSEFRVILPGQEASWRMCDAKPERTEDGGTLWYGIITDITSRKRTEQIQKLIYSISEAVNLTENMDELIGFIRLELGTLIDTTNFFVAIYDEIADTISLPYFADKKDDHSSFPAGKSLTAYLIKSDQSIFATRAEIDKLEASGIVETIGTKAKVWLGVPLKVRGKTTGAIVVQSYDNENAFTSEDLSFLEFISSTISIAIDRKKAEEELKTAMLHAMESDKLKSAFLTNMSHEIRTPMNAIMGFSNLMTEVEGAEKDHYASIVQKSSKQLLNLIEDIVFLSRLQSEKLTIQNSEFKPTELVTDVFQMFNHPDFKKDLEVRLKIPDEYQNLTVLSDVAKIKQVLTNLASNAIKYTFTGSIQLGFEVVDGFVEFFVKDTGIGIPVEEQNRIFDTFFRGEMVVSAAIGGTGLGLNIAKELVELLGGRIGVESEPDYGSLFYFTIPFDKALTLHPEIQEAADNPQDWTALTMLIAEDEPDNYLYLEILLNQKFKRIDHAINGKEAVAMAEQNKYDIILMDLKMPVLGGIEATELIKKKFPNIPVIAQTAYALPVEKASAMQAGCDDYLTKPIRRLDLINSISKFI